MNILIVASKFPPEYSGPGVRIPRLYRAIGPELGVKKISVLCNGLEKPFNEDYDFEGWPVRRRVPARIRSGKFPLGLLPRIAIDNIAYTAETIDAMGQLDRYRDADLVHILGHSGATAAALHWARKNNKPVMIELVTAQANPCQKFLILGKSCPPENCVIVTFRSDTEEKCRRAGYGRQIWKRPNPIDENIYFPEPSRKNDLRARLTPFAADDIVICTVAKIIPQKNQLFLIDVIKQLPEKFKLVIAGPIVEDGPYLARDRAYLDSIRTAIAAGNLGQRVFLKPDYVPSADFMKLADIYALPAENEGFATPMLEANACGLPVIANSGEYAFREWIVDGENGFLCPLESVEWAQACLKASLLPAAQKSAQAARIAALAGQKNIYKTYTDLIKDLVAKPKA